MIVTKTGSQKTATQSGFSLVEVLITLVIMSVGMLGIAGLYVQGLQAGRTSMFRHQAVTLGGDVADRIRANPTGGIAYEAATGANNSCVGGTVNCTPAQMAANDILLWGTQVSAALPSGAIAVDYTAGAGIVPASYDITVSWVEPGETPSFAITIPVLER
jgi:type IV pilus assembly protein PilV